MGMMEEIRERARAEAELLPPSLAVLKSTEAQVSDLHKKLNIVMEQIEGLHQRCQSQEAQLANIEAILKRATTKKSQPPRNAPPPPKKEKKKWTFWTF